MLTIGARLPEFKLKACVSLENGKEFEDISNDSFKGKWLVLFSWPLDFTFVCPTEIQEFGNQTAAFAKKDAQVLGLSADSHFVHLAWRKEDERLSKLPFPMLADIKREFLQELGIIHPEEGVPLRATFIIDPEGVIRFASAHDLPTGRNVDEVLRTLDALQCGGLCPVGWTEGQDTINP